MRITVLILALALGGAAACDYQSNPSAPDYSNSILVARPVLAVAGGHTGFGFNGTAGGRVFLTGGGSFVAATASNVEPSQRIVSGGGGFRCVTAVAQGALNGCGEGEGVRWEAVQLLTTATFRCSAADAPKTGATAAGTVALLARFFRAGDGTEPSFTAQIIISDSDIAADVPGVQTLWVQGVGCDEAQTSFSGQ